MANVLMIYGTGYGQTAKIVRRIADLLERDGHTVTTRKGDARDADHTFDSFDGVIVAASVRGGKHQKYIRDFARRHAVALSQRPSAFISVCAALASGTETGRREAARHIERFVTETGWHPRVTRSFAGAVNYRDYPLPLRWVMKFIVWRNGGPTDTSRNYEFTDWDAVDRFAADLSVGLPRQAVLQHR